MNAKEFLRTVSTTEWDVDSLVRLAHSHGYRFDAEDLETAADELWGHLSEDELHEITGGGEGRVTVGPVSVDLSGTGKKKEGTWSPPPGDVSGNSCFFIRG